MFKYLPLFALFLVWTGTVFAAEPPVQTQPSNNQTVSSSTLSWQTPTYSLYATNPYRVQVHQDQSFSSPYRDYYTTNTSYNPTLADGVWYWRVKAKDSSGSWSEWSSTLAFNLSSTTLPSPSPSTVSPSPSPQNAATATGGTSTFEASKVPAQVDSNQPFGVSIYFQSTPNSTFYLKGAFKKTDSNNYFGYTKVNGWVKNSAKATEQKQVVTDSEGKWAGDLEVMADPEDAGYTGSGTYIIKVGRYNSAGENLTWSNETTININNVPLPPTPSPKSSTTSPKPTNSPKITTTSKPNTSAAYLDKYKPASPSALVEAVSETKVKNNFNPILLSLGGVFFGLGIGSVGLLYYKSK